MSFVTRLFRIVLSNVTRNFSPIILLKVSMLVSVKNKYEQWVQLLAMGFWYLQKGSLVMLHAWNQKLAKIPSNQLFWTCPSAPEVSRSKFF